MKKKSFAAVAAAGLVLTLVSCAAPGSSAESDTDGDSAAGPATSTSESLPSEPGSLTMASANFPESDILAHVFADAMEAEGVEVTVRSGIGERPAYMSALKDGSIDAIPEYAGAILLYLDEEQEVQGPEETYAALQKVVVENDLVVGDYSQAQDSDTVTVTRETAEKYDLTTIADLKDVAPKLRLGAPAPFQTDAYGVRGMKRVYGVEFGEFVPLSAGGSITATALKNGTVDAADIFSTDPSIEKYDFVVLEDPKNEFPSQNVVPLFREGVLTAPMKTAADAVTAKLTTDALRQMVAEAADGATSEAVAAKWVKANGLD